MPATPSWPNPSIGPDGFSFPTSFQDSFHRSFRTVAEEDESGNTAHNSEQNRLDKVRKLSSLTINIPQSSGYDSYEENPKTNMHTMDIVEQDNQENDLHEQKRFLDSTDGNDESHVDTNVEAKRRRKRKEKKCFLIKVALASVLMIVILFGVIFGAIALAKHLDNDDGDTSVGDSSTKPPKVDIITTPKSQINTDVAPAKDPNNSVVAIRMVIDENYAQKGKGHMVLWKAPPGKHIHQGISYNNGSFQVPVDGYYTYTSTLIFDTRIDDLEPGKEIRFHHCVHISNTEERSCSTNGVPPDAIRSDIVHASWVHIRAGQEVYVTIDKVGYISDSSDGNTFTMNLEKEAS